MATRKQLEQYAKNPNVRKFLDLIAYTEGTQGNGYRTAFGGGRLNSLNDHPRYMKSFKQKNGKTNKTSAAGRYQFLSRTWDGLARQYGLKDFGGHSQDLAAIGLLAQNGALGHILKGDMQGAVRKSGATWASLPTAPASYSQPTKSWQAVNKFLGGKAAPSKAQPQTPVFQAPTFRSASELQKNPSFAAPTWQSASALKGAPVEPSFKAPEWQSAEVAPANNTEPSGFTAPEWNPPLEQDAQQQPTFKQPEWNPPEQLQVEQPNTTPELEPQEWQT